MYKLSVPIMNHSINQDTRHEYLEQVKKIGADRVFLVTDRCLTEQAGEITATALKENISFFKQHGVETAIWLAATIGHGMPLLHESGEAEKDNYTLLTAMDGVRLPSTYCPLDSGFVKALSRFLALLAQTGTDLILLDDDFRLNQRGDFCCTCEMHMKKISDLCGESLTREELRVKAFSERPNKYRDAWLSVQGDSLRGFAIALRSAVDEVNKDVTLALCSPYCTWGIDGVDSLELTKILAGDNPPLLRLHGAPYWAVSGGTPLPSVFEVAKMLSFFCKESKVEIMAEGDVYPRPCYNVPASYLEIYDAFLRAEGSYDGILKYMFDYTSSPHYETGYIQHHVADLSLFKGIENMFAHSQKTGAKIYERPHVLQHADFTLSPVSQTSPYPMAGTMFAFSGIPTVYSDAADAEVVFGDNARYLSPDVLGKYLVLDAVSAVILQQSGIDVGLRCITDFEESCISFENFLLQNERITILSGSGRFLNAEYAPGITVESKGITASGERTISYRYENATGQRFLVFLFDAMSLSRNSGLLRGYARQHQLVKAMEWLSNKRLPAICTGHPDLYMICAYQDDSFKIALFNCFMDSVLHPEISLNHKYKNIKFLNCNGEIKENSIFLKTDIAPFSFAAFEVSE